MESQLGILNAFWGWYCGDLPHEFMIDSRPMFIFSATLLNKTGNHFGTQKHHLKSRPSHGPWLLGKRRSILSANDWRIPCFNGLVGNFRQFPFNKPYVMLMATGFCLAKIGFLHPVKPSSIQQANHVAGLAMQLFNLSSTLLTLGSNFKDHLSLSFVFFWMWSFSCWVIASVPMATCCGRGPGCWVLSVGSLAGSTEVRQVEFVFFRYWVYFEMVFSWLNIFSSCCLKPKIVDHFPMIIFGLVTHAVWGICWGLSDYPWFNG